MRGYPNRLVYLLIISPCLLITILVGCKQDSADRMACDLRLDFSINGQDFPNSCEIIGDVPQSSDTDLVQYLAVNNIEITLNRPVNGSVRLHIDGLKIKPLIQGKTRYKLTSSGIRKISLCTDSNCLSKWIYLPANKVLTQEPIVSREVELIQEETVSEVQMQKSEPIANPIVRTTNSSQVQNSSPPTIVERQTDIVSPPNPEPSRPVEDTDRDGVPDYRDDCVNEFGSASNRGCPEKETSKPVSTILDSDNDGVPDNTDQCKDVKGLARFFGCPDTDKDGIPDHKDKCAQQRGPERFQGCPDSDRDGIPDNLDECPEEKGDKSNNGCPIAIAHNTTEKIEEAVIKSPANSPDNAAKQNTTTSVRLSSYGSAIIPSDYNCAETSSNFNSGSFQMRFTIKARVQLLSLSVVSNSNWSGDISLTAVNGNMINSVSNERILDGITEINLTQLAKYIEPGDYVLEVNGQGQLGNIETCNHSSSSTKQMSVRSNNYFFNLDYKY